MDQLFAELATLNAAVNASGGAATVTVTATATGNSQSSQTEAPNSSTSSAAASTSSSSNIGAAVGAGVGVPLGILALGILGFLFYRERRHSHFTGQPTPSRANIMEMEPPKTYYNPPPPPPPEPQSYGPFSEVSGQSPSPVSQSALLAGRGSMQKTAAYNHGPSSDVHEMI
jgi:hypothetical protein